MVCYKVEELGSIGMTDAKLQHVFLTFSSAVLLQKCKNWAWKRKKFCGNKTSISCEKTGEHVSFNSTYIRCTVCSEIRLSSTRCCRNPNKLSAVLHRSRRRTAT